MGLCGAVGDERVKSSDFRRKTRVSTPHCITERSELEKAGGLTVGVKRIASIFRFRSARRGKPFGIAAYAGMPDVLPGVYFLTIVIVAKRLAAITLWGNIIDMKKISNVNAMKVLKIFHILFGIMWIGGVMALVSIMLGVQPQGVEQMYAVAMDHLVIDKFFLIPGGIGIVLTALVYSIFTKWGFFKVKWVGVKWVLTVVLVLIGKVYMGVTIEKNMDYAAMMLTESLPEEPFFANVRNVAIAGIVQLVGFAAILILSVMKPWTKSRKNLPTRTVIPLFAAIALHTTGKLIHLQGNEALFLVGVLCFILGHVCYLYVIIRGLGQLKAFQWTLLAGIPLVLCWMPAVALNINMPMTTVSVFVMLAILLYVSCGIAGMLNKRREYVLILLGGICFLVSDAITGMGVTTPVGYAVSQVAFYIAEIFVISGILVHSRSDSAERDGSYSEI